MKKVLLATTALVATAGFAAAEIKITGSANMGLKFQEDRADASVAAVEAATEKDADGDAIVLQKAVTDNNVSDTVIHNEIDFNIVASGTSDSGVEFGASVDLDASEADQRDTQSGSGANDPEVYVSYNGFKVTVGAVGNAGVVLNTGDVGFDGIDTNSYTDMVDSNDGKWYDMDVHASYSISGITIAASVGSDSEDMGVSVSGEFSGVSFALGYAEDGADNSVSHTSLGLGYTAGALDVQALYVAQDNPKGTDDIATYGLAVTYTSGAMSVRVAASDSDKDNTDMNYGVGVTYDLGGGLAVAGGVGRIGADAKTRADLGLTMSF